MIVYRTGCLATAFVSPEAFSALLWSSSEEEDFAWFCEGNVLR